MSEHSVSSSADGLHSELTHQIIGAAIEVQRRLGIGLLEPSYAIALGIELEHLGLPYEQQVVVAVRYKEHIVGECVIDFVVADKVVVQLETVPEVTELHVAQTLAVMRASGYRVGLLANFSVAPLARALRRLAL